MTASLFASFLLVSLLVIAMPGPNILVIVSTSLAAGRKRGLQTVMGTSLAMLIQLAIAALATSGLISLINHGLMWLRWAGILYLLYLALNAFKNINHARSAQHSALGSFHRGFWVSLTNPKTILFFTAFLPQFVSSESDYLLQISALSLAFWILAVSIDSVYAILAARLRWLLANKQAQRIQNGLSGTLYLAASALLASTHRA